MKINKTVKLYIGGKFVRSESGRIFKNTTNNASLNICLASKKDFKLAVEKCKQAQKVWHTTDDFLKSQILYRMAEMLSSRSIELCNILSENFSFSADDAKKEVAKSIDAIIHYSGFCDKYNALLSSNNSVTGNFVNYTTCSPVGVVTLICDDNISFSSMLKNLLAIIVSGNSAIVIFKKMSSVLSLLAEVINSSDFNAGVINLLSADFEELIPVISTHREVRSISFQVDNQELLSDTVKLSVDNVKRVVPLLADENSLLNISKFVEFKTCWHTSL